MNYKKLKHTATGLTIGLAFLLGSQAVLAAQPIKSNFEMPAGQSEYTYESPVYTAKGAFTGVIAQWGLHSEEGDGHGHDSGVEIYFRSQATDDNAWSEWLSVSADIDHLDKVPEHLDTIINVEASQAYQYKVLLSDDHAEVEGLKFTFINVPAPKTEPKARVAGFDVSGFVPVITRDQWGAVDEYNYYSGSTDTSDVDTSTSSNPDADKEDDISHSDPDIENIIYTEGTNQLKWPYQYAKKIRFLVVHHTVSSAGSDPKQALRNIQYYHAISRGWGDIGYNYIIDPQGRIYEGRKGGERVIGGHSIPVNKTSIGVSVMGNYQVDTPPKAVLEALSRILTAKAELYDLEPLANDTYNNRVYPVISGHRDTDATACPGEFLYRALPGVKALVSRSMSNIDPSELPALDQDPLRDITEMGPQETKIIDIQVKNNSSETWQKDNVYLGYFNVEEVANVVQFPAASPSYRVTTLVENKDIAPGELATFRLTVTGTTKGGFAYLNLIPVINKKIKSNNLIFVPIYVDQGKFKFTLDTTNKTLDLEPGQSTTLDLKLKNSGNFTWNFDSNTVAKLGMDKPRDADSLLISEEVGQGRVWESSRKVAPGETVSIRLPVKAPNTRIDRTEVLRPVIDGFGWGTGTPLTIKLDNTVDETQFEGQSLSGDRFERVVRRSYANVRAPIVSSGVDSKTIRVHLSYFKKSSTRVGLNTNYKLVVDNKLKRRVRSFDNISVKEEGDLVAVTVNNSTYKGRVVRLIPNNAEVAIFELKDYENRPGWNQSLNDNQFRGAAEFRSDGGLIAINELPMTHYLRGIAEVSNGSNPEMIKTLMILARTYSVYYLDPNRNKFRDKPYDLDDSPDRTQKYLGYGFEKRSPNVAIYLADVTNQVVTYNGDIVITPYFSRSGGRTLSAEEVWGWTHTPFLVSVDDKYCANADPNTAAGHGVGLSGCGGSGMAAAGFNYQEIIKYFYTGVSIDSR